MEINIIKSDKDYSKEIEEACEILNLKDKEYKVEFYFGKDVEKDYEKIYGSKYEISAGAYSEKGDRIFIKETKMAIIAHELSHLKFRKMYKRNNENAYILDFIDEYLAKKVELFVNIKSINDNKYIIEIFNKYGINEILDEQITLRKKELEIMSKRLKTTTTQLKYMRRIANMIAWKKYLENFKSYDYKNNIQYDLIDGLSIWDNIFDDINYNNVNEKYSEIEKVYKDYEDIHLKYINLDRTLILD